MVNSHIINSILQAPDRQRMGLHLFGLTAFQKLADVCLKVAQERAFLFIDGFGLFNLIVKLFKKLTKLYIVHSKSPLSDNTKLAAGWACHAQSLSPFYNCCAPITNPRSPPSLPQIRRTPVGFGGGAPKGRKGALALTKPAGIILAATFFVHHCGLPGPLRALSMD